MTYASLRRLLFFCMTTAIVVVSSGTAVEAQAWRPIQTTDGDSQGLAASASVSTSRELTAQVDELLQRLHGKPGLGEFEDVLRLLDRQTGLLTASDDFPTHPTVLLANWQTATDEKTRDRLEEYADPILRKRLQPLMSTRDVAGVADFAFHYRGFVAGRAALRWLIAFGLDRGDPFLVEVGVDRLLAAPRVTPGEIRQARLQQYLALLQNDDVDAARSYRARHAKDIDAAVADVQARAGGVSIFLPEQPASPERSATGEAALGGSDAITVPQDMPLAVPQLTSETFARSVSDLHVPQMVRHGLTSFPALSAQYLADEHAIIVRSADGLVLWDTNAQAVRWQADVDYVIPPKVATAESSPKWFPDEATRRRESESLSAAMNIDQGMVFTVEWPSEPWFLRMSGDERTARQTRPVPRLVARDIRDGAIVWQTDGNNFAKGQVFIHSAPVVIGRRLVLLCESGNDLRLALLETATGRLIDSRVIAIGGQELDDDPLRAQTAAVLAYRFGRLYCATGAGLLAVVDPITWNVESGFRYLMRDRQSKTNEKRLNPGNWINQWWRGPRGVHLQFADQRLMMASPESDTAFVLDIDRQRVVTRFDAAESLHIESLEERTGARRFLVVQSNGVSSIDGQAGETLWTSTISRPTGRGAVIGDHYVLPVDGGRLAKIALTDGTTHVSRNPPGTNLGHLLSIGKDVVSISPWQLTWHRTIPAIPSSEAGLPEELTSEGLRSHVTTAIAQAVEQDALDDALRIYREGLGVEDDPFAEIWLSWASSILERRPENRQAVLNAGEVIRLKPADVWKLQFDGAEAAQRVGAPDEALDRLASLAGAGSDQYRIVLEEGRRIVRGDPAVQAEILQILSALEVMQRDAALRRMGLTGSDSKSNTDPFASARLNVAFRDLPAAQRRLADPNLELGPGEDLREVELQLLDLEQRAAPDVQAMAAARRQALVARHWPGTDGPTPDAEMFNLCRDFEESNSTGEDSPTDDPAAAACPHVEVVAPEIDDCYYTPVPVTSMTAARSSRLDVAVSRQFDSLRFSTAGQPGTWDVSLRRAGNSNRYFYGYAQAWELGRLLIVRLGTDLFGIAPYDELLQRSAEVLWSVDMLPPHAQGNLNSASRVSDPELPGFESHALFDCFGFPLGQMFAVQPGAIAYRSGGRIIAVEPWSGRRMWSLDGVDANVMSVADAGRLAMIDPETNELVVRRLFDGAPQSRSQLPFSIDEVRASSGDLCLVPSGEDRRKFRCIAVLDGNTRWTREFAPTAVFGPLDERHFTTASNNPATGGGQVEVVEWKTGITVWRQSSNLNGAIDRVAGFNDGTNWYVATSLSMESRSRWLGAQVRSGHRAFPVYGELSAISVGTGKTVWTRPLEDVMLSIDQPRAVPLLLLMFRRPGVTDDPSLSEGEVLVLDKRDGSVQARHSERPFALYHSWEPRPELSRFDLHFPRATIRFRYGTSAEPIAPEPAPAPTPPPQPE